MCVYMQEVHVRSLVLFPRVPATRGGSKQASRQAGMVGFITLQQSAPSQMT